MGPVGMTAFVFLVGLTVCGLTGSTMELISGRRLAFADPYVSPAHVARSLGATAFAGPFMLANEALEARRQGRLSMFALISCFCTAFAWTLASGTVLVAVASWATNLLRSAAILAA